MKYHNPASSVLLYQRSDPSSSSLAFGQSTLSSTKQIRKLCSAKLDVCRCSAATCGGRWGLPTVELSKSKVIFVSMNPKKNIQGQGVRWEYSTKVEKKQPCDLDSAVIVHS